jgi:hypothetical protein
MSESVELAPARVDPLLHRCPFLEQSTSTPGQPYSSLTSAPLILAIDFKNYAGQIE